VAGSVQARTTKASSESTAPAAVTSAEGVTLDALLENCFRRPPRHKPSAKPEALQASESSLSAANLVEKLEKCFVAGRSSVARLISEKSARRFASRLGAESKNS